jgi:hypothetical protein
MFHDTILEEEDYGFVKIRKYYLSPSGVNLIMVLCKSGSLAPRPSPSPSI